MRLKFEIKGGGKLNRLARQMKNGDERAAAVLYDELAGKVFGFCMNRLGHRGAAEDLAQDIFVKLLDRIGMFDEKKGDFHVWFWRLARNTLIDYYRAKKEMSFADLGDEYVGSFATEGQEGFVETKLQREKLTDFVALLGEEEKNVFELRYLAELSYDEISELTGKSAGALRVVVNRLRNKIKERFKEDKNENSGFV